MKEFCFDGQLHIPPERIEETLALAINRGLDAVFFTDYGNTDSFNFISANDNDKTRVLDSNKWNIEQKSQTLLKLSNQYGNIYVLKAEEIKTRQGHILAWGIKEPIKNGLDIKETFNQIYQQKGIGVFSHLFMTLFHGCAREGFDYVYNHFRSYPLGVEQNGQVGKSWEMIFHPNKKIKELAEEYGVACFGTSDIHGRYLQEHRNIGKRYHSSIPREYIEPDRMTESLAEVMSSRQEVVKVVGDTNSTLETILWNLSSIRKNGKGKMADLVDGVIGSF